MDEPTEDNVYRSEWKGQRVVIKRAFKREEENHGKAHLREKVESLKREAAILKDLADRHIIQYYELEAGPCPRLIMEDSEGGNLEETIPKLVWEHKRRIAGEIAHGLAYMHSLGIIHCDIKSRNVLLTKKLVVKICDFGSAMTTKDKKNKKPICGTSQWMAPELQRDVTAYSPKSDMYALGIVMFEMASGYGPPKSKSQVLEEIQRLENVPEDYRAVMESCCDLDPTCRPEAQDLLNMKYERGLEEGLERLLLMVRGGDVSKQAFSITVAQSAVCDMQVDFDTEKNTLNINLVQVKDQVILKNESSEESLLESANKGCDRSKTALALVYYESERYCQALDFARQASYIPEACYVMGEMYSHGHGVVHQNEGEAHRWHHEAAKGGFSKSQVLIARGYAQAGHCSEAVYWYRLAAEGGDLNGQYNLGQMIYNGRGVRLDREEGARWIRKAADRGHTSAVAAMGVVCLDLEEYPEAMLWCLQAGDPISHYRVGLMYFNGWVGTEPNCADVIEWFQKAIKQRCGLAAFALAEMYRKGTMVEKDMDEAIRLYRLGHEYGDIESTNTLALILKEQGGNVKKYNQLLNWAKEKGSVLAEANILLRSM
ncbi:Dual specificity testis-specific protein kinase 2 [Mortierella antarctica]|nr:Dual specificity testis-specific protein kinase 2 [Mortierella antarctica]